MRASKRAPFQVQARKALGKVSYQRGKKGHSTLTAKERKRHGNIGKRYYKSIKSAFSK